MSFLDTARIEAELSSSGTRLGRPLFLFEETESTNDDAKRAARSKMEEGAAFVANLQTRGRGRRGHAWYSPPGDSLYVSFLLRPRLVPRKIPPLALASGLAVVDAVAPLVGRDRLRIKWPNDVLLDEKKLGGVLIEASIAGDSVDAVIVGIGLNVHTKSFPPELSSLATSLAIAGAEALDRSTLFISLCRALEARIDEQVGGGISRTVEALAPLDFLRGKRVETEEARGVAMGIDGEGRLRVLLDNGSERALSAGEVTIGTR